MTGRPGLWLAALLLCACPQTAAADLTSPEPLTAAYDLILDARFDEAERQIAKACPPAPRPGCDVLRAVAGYWRLLQDPDATQGDAAVLARIDASIASTEAWVEREPRRAEAWFYLGGAYGTRVLFRGQRSQLLAAARDGKRIHNALRQALTLDPSLGDAYFGLGLYHYYAAVAPRFARLLSVLLLLPGGDRAGGLKEMEQARSQGVLLQGEADFQLHLIYLWYERQAATALRLIEGLRKRYPHNPVFYVKLAEVQGTYNRDHAAALRTYRELYDAALASRVAEPLIAQFNARLGMAREMDALCDANGAIEQLRAAIEQQPSAPYSAIARAEYQLGLALDHSGRRTEAIAAYKRALSSVPRDDRLRIGEHARAAMRRAPARPCR
jgi:tetratricopeptide (TPR) repeat protein